MESPAATNCGTRKSITILICQGCGTVVGFDCPFLQEFLSQSGQAWGFEITGVDLHLVGYCAECKGDGRQ